MQQNRVVWISRYGVPFHLWNIIFGLSQILQQTLVIRGNIQFLSTWAVVILHMRFALWRLNRWFWSIIKNPRVGSIILRVKIQTWILIQMIMMWIKDGRKLKNKNKWIPRSKMMEGPNNLMPSLKMAALIECLKQVLKDANSSGE